MASCANIGPVKRENILSLTEGDRHGKDEKNTVVERMNESKLLLEKHSQKPRGTLPSIQTKQENKS